MPIFADPKRLRPKELDAVCLVTSGVLDEDRLKMIKQQHGSLTRLLSDGSIIVDLLQPFDGFSKVGKWRIHQMTTAWLGGDRIWEHHHDKRGILHFRNSNESQQVNNYEDAVRVFGADGIWVHSEPDDFPPVVKVTLFR
jgi:hypothetical protein